MFSLLFLLVFTPLITGCGIVTHTYIAQKALSWFDDDYASLLQREHESFLSGAIFPDWGYDCFLKKEYPFLPAASESAHHGNFQEETINYLKVHPSDSLTAFLMGVVSHATADISWHDLFPVSTTGQGFIQSLTYANFDNIPYNSTQHTIADVGGDFLIAYTKNLSFIPHQWVLPTSALVVIYQRLGFPNITDDILTQCHKELYLYIREMKQHPSRFFFEYYSHQSPFLLDQLERWWIGGLWDLSIWTLRCWNATIKSLTNPFSPCFLVPLVQTPYHYRSGSINYRNLRKNGFPHKETKIYQDGCHIFEEDAYAIFYSYQYSEPLGVSLAMGNFSRRKFSNNSYPDLVIGSPYQNGMGIVYHIWGQALESQNVKSPIMINLDTNPYVAISSGRHTGDLYGSNLEVIDFNLDGFDDLVISQGGTDWDKLNYRGHINIYYDPFGNLNKKDSFSHLDPYSIGGYSFQKGNFSGQGFHDSIIGFPFVQNHETHYLESGQVFVFFPMKDHEKIPSIILYSSQFYSWFGFATLFISHGSVNFLIVSSPLYHNGTCHIGRVDGYNTSCRISKSLCLSWTINGNFCNGQFGYALAFHNETLVISSPSQRSGIIYFLHPFNLKGNFSIDQVEEFRIENHKASHERRPNRLGSQVGFTKSGKFWVVEQTTGTLNIWNEIDGNRIRKGKWFKEQSFQCWKDPTSFNLRVAERDDHFLVSTFSSKGNIYYIQ